MLSVLDKQNYIHSDGTKENIIRLFLYKHQLLLLLLYVKVHTLILLYYIVCTIDSNLKGNNKSIVFQEFRDRFHFYLSVIWQEIILGY